LPESPENPGRFNIFRKEHRSGRVRGCFRSADNSDNSEEEADNKADKEKANTLAHTPED